MGSALLKCILSDYLNILISRINGVGVFKAYTSFISQGHNLRKLIYIYISLEEVFFCNFNNDFKARLQKVTYIGYI